MRIRRLGVILAATGAAVTMSLSASPAFAADAGARGGTTIEKFVCFRDAGDRIMMRTGTAIMTPSGQRHVVCPGQPL